MEALLAGSGGGAGSVMVGAPGGGSIKITAGGKLIIGKNQVTITIGWLSAK